MAHVEGFNEPKRKIFISKRNNDNSDDTSEGESSEALFMVFLEKREENKNEKSSSSSDEEGEINFEAEFQAAMKELNKEWKNNKFVTRELKNQKQLIQDLRVQDVESKKINNSLKTQLEQVSIDRSTVMTENVGLRAQLEIQAPVMSKFEELEKEFILLKAKVTEYEKEELERHQKLNQPDEPRNTPVHPSSSKLYGIINSQRPSNVKFGLGFDKGETSNSANSKKKGPISFVKESGKGKAPMVYVQEENHVSIPQTTNARQGKRMKQNNFYGRNYPSAPQRQMRYMAPSRPKSYFQGYCFKCNVYGPKIATCKFNMREVRFES